MMNTAGAGANLEKRLRTMRVLWGAFIWNVFLFASLVYVVDPAEVAGGRAPGDLPATLLIFFAVGLAAVGLSFVLKPRFLKRAADEQRPEHVQTGTILALVLCEVAALAGLVSLFVNGSRYAYLLFVVAVAGQLLHFPRREHLLAASYKT